MSSEVHRYIEESLKKKENLFDADVISFPNEKKNTSNDLMKDNYKTWKLYDESNSKEDDDQYKAVLGICFMVSVLLIMGLYSNLT